MVDLLQVAEALLDAIRHGRYKPGDNLPSYKALASEHDVAIGTVQSAIARLREQGVVATRHGTGSVVRADLDVEALGDSRNVAPWMEALRLLRDIAKRVETIETKLNHGH
ncbi:GntR family transcriptional regulator [Amycolatopsis saalfeldensis]|uniref:Regulatory protein, gntR family n=1 Tax=Amycolatopsis saalfeldensis TaxID=394193 RepID=A0A1H8YGC8_9PSEU|nr:winged helix-turn-helix domain-containing protein [Amycolatopsis saalfeldensis]SEP51260.1 regulatory protein, gntR family [Amycolatopsis saalfeldensis]